MYLSKLYISGFRQFGQGDAAVELTFQPGVTALIGKNDSGKTAIIDAIRYALLSRDQMYFKVQPESCCHVNCLHLLHLTFPNMDFG